RIPLEAFGNARPVMGEPRSAAFLVDEAQDSARREVVDFLARKQPPARQRSLAPPHFPLRRRHFVTQVTMFVLEQVAQIFISKQPEQATASGKGGSELKIRQIRAAVAPAQPVLLLGKIVVTDPCAMELAERNLGRLEKRAVAMWLGDVHDRAVDPTTHEHLPARIEERRRDSKLTRDDERAALPCEQHARKWPCPPRHLIDPAHDRRRLAAGRAKATALHRGKEIALEHQFARPPPLDLGWYTDRHA